MQHKKGENTQPLRQDDLPLSLSLMEINAECG
jgi:hypothetical protein